MKIVHWVLKNGSGMNTVAQDMADAERDLGLPSIALNCGDKAEIDAGIDADIHVVHTHIPDKVDIGRSKDSKVVWVAHGTPEHCFTTSLEKGTALGPSASDSWMISLRMLQMADASVTFWPRHQAIWQNMADRRTIVECIPMGVSSKFWNPPAPGVVTESMVGNPSILALENSHAIKWPLDFCFAFPELMRKHPEIKFHLFCLPFDQFKWWMPLINRTGAAYKSYVNAMRLSKPEMLQAFHGADFMLSPVRYGDFNRTCLEAAASGCKVISFNGNPYAHYWIPEGDHRIQAEAIDQIIKGNAAEMTPRAKPVDNEVMAREMIKVYERITGAELLPEAEATNGDQ
jgi:hypothetical protein